MKPLLFYVVLLSVAIFPAILPAAEQGMKEGLWEISTTVKMPGMPFIPPPSTITHCYTKEDVKNEQTVLPQEQGGDCKVTDLQRSGSKVSWKVTCSGKNPGKGEGEIVFKGYTSYEGTTKLEMETATMTTHYDARRIGDCK